MALFQIRHQHLPMSHTMDEFGREIEGLLENLEGGSDGRGALDLPLDLIEDGNSFTVKIELPGVDPKDVAVSFQDGTLTVQGEKKEEAETAGRNVRHAERRYGSFHRLVKLPRSVDSEKIAAEFAQGVLTVTIPKREETKPRMITIKATGN